MNYTTNQILYNKGWYLQMTIKEYCIKISDEIENLETIQNYDQIEIESQQLICNEYRKDNNNE